MPNNIALSKNYITILDAVYKKASLTSVLDSDPGTAQQGNRANEIVIPKLSMDGLADYSRNGGYVGGDVKLTHETVTFNYDRGRKFSIDYIDNEESAEVPFMNLASEFMRTKVVPEKDAFTFATLAGLDGISKVSAGATLADGAAVMDALRVGADKMDDDEVPEEQRYVIKSWKKVPNKWIPTILAVIGVIVALWVNGWSATPEIVLSGLVSGLGSCGLYDTYKHFFINGKTESEAK